MMLEMAYLTLLVVAILLCMGCFFISKFPHKIKALDRRKIIRNYVIPLSMVENVDMLFINGKLQIEGNDYFSLLYGVYFEKLYAGDIVIIKTTEGRTIVKTIKE